VKPEYRIPTIKEINAAPKNGFNVISLFSGCGGSSTGYRLAGFKVLYANEFIPAAREAYKANCAEYTYVDGRDVRTVTPEDIMEKIGLGVGELDLLDGSPPCASFSTAGKREKGWGKVKDYSDSAQRTDDLFFEYTRILQGLKPKVFVAENVSGLVQGTAKGYFLIILNAMKACGYRVSAQLLNSEWLGVPQARRRIIFVGVREDLKMDPVFPKPLPYNYTMKDALPWIGKVERLGGYEIVTNCYGERESRLLEIENKPFPTVMASQMVQIAETHPDKWKHAIDKYERLVGPYKPDPIHNDFKRRYPTIAEMRQVCSFPDDFILTGKDHQQWERMGRSVPPMMMCHIASAIRDKILCQTKN